MQFIDNIISKFSQDIAIDLGTANVRVFFKGLDEIIKEPSVIALNSLTGKILAVGNDARVMIGRTPANIVALQPLKDGVISDFSAAEAIIHYFINKSQNKANIKNLIFRPRVIIGVPSSISEVEINAVVDSAKSAGARKVYIVEEPVAAAVGADLKIESALGNLIVDIGGGTTDIAVISMGGIVVDNTVKIAGDEMDQAIVEYIKNKYNLLIGIKMAEDMKIRNGNIAVNKDLGKFMVKGQDLISGLPKSTEISSHEVSEALTPVISKITLAIKEAIEKSPPEIISDLITNGIFLSGGGSLIKGLDKYISSELKIAVHIVDDPIYSVVKGISKMLDNISLLESLKIKDLILK